MSLRTPLGLHRVCAQDEDGAEDVTEGQRMLMLSLPPVPKVILRMAFSRIFRIFFPSLSSCMYAYNYDIYKCIFSQFSVSECVTHDSHVTDAVTMCVCVHCLICHVHSLLLRKVKSSNSRVNHLCCQIYLPPLDVFSKMYHSLGNALHSLRNCLRWSWKNQRETE